jgi:hypothetical protein
MADTPDEEMTEVVDVPGEQGSWLPKWLQREPEIVIVEAKEDPAFSPEVDKALQMLGLNRDGFAGSLDNFNATKPGAIDAIARQRIEGILRNRGMDPDLIKEYWNNPVPVDRSPAGAPSEPATPVHPAPDPSTPGGGFPQPGGFDPAKKIFEGGHSSVDPAQMGPEGHHPGFDPSGTLAAAPTGPGELWSDESGEAGWGEDTTPIGPAADPPGHLAGAAPADVPPVERTDQLLADAEGPGLASSDVPMPHGGVDGASGMPEHLADTSEPAEGYAASDGPSSSDTEYS